MDIKRILTRGGKPFAAEIVDGSETYKVFLEALGNTVILPELIKSGWVLKALPLSLCKDGVDLLDLPAMECSPTLAEEQDMYDTLGTEMSMEERKKLIPAHVASTIQAPKGNYTIHTREDFLDYLVNKSKLKSGLDFLPINYFVHPAARFTLEEYKDPANARYIQLLNQRRQFTLAQFLNLRAWALRNGLKPDFESQDFVSFYFQWGICGLTTGILAKRTTESYILRDMQCNDLEHAKVKTCDYGLIDRFKNVYYKPGTERYKPADPQGAAYIASMLQDNETTPIKLARANFELVEMWDTLETTIMFNQRFVCIGDTRYPGISAQGKCGYISPAHWNPAKEQEMDDDMFLRAMAIEFIERRKNQTEVSTYRALIESGCSPYSALVYVRDRDQMDKAEALPDEDRPAITDQDILSYLQGKEVDPAIDAILNSIVEGTYNLDCVARGLTSDSEHTSEKVYVALYCAHHVLGVSLDSIYNAIHNFESGTPLKFSNGEISISLPSAPIDAAYRGFLRDKADYRLKQAEQAFNYLWVTRVARELGTEEATRHVGFMGYVSTPSTTRDMIVATIMREYATTVEEEVSDPRTKEAYMTYSKLFAVNSFMSGAVLGYYRYPTEICDKIVRLSPEDFSLYKSCVSEPRTDDLLAVCDDMVFSGWAGDWKWYTVNAILTPMEVTPRLGYSISETSLAAVWNNLATAPIYPELLRRGLVRRNEPAWRVSSALSPVFKERMDARGLPYYYATAVDTIAAWDTSQHFVAVPHIAEIAYPKIYAPAEETTPAGLNEECKFAVGYGRVIEYAPVPTEGVTCGRASTAPVSFFKGLTAEDFHLTGGKFTLPTLVNKTPILVVDGTYLYIGNREIRPADVERLNPEDYPVAHLCGRKFLVCDHVGRYWVVEV